MAQAALPNDHPDAVAARNPQTTAARLASIAQVHPQLRGAIAANPAAYPELLTWLGQVDQSPAVQHVLAARGIVGPPTPPKRGIPGIVLVIVAIVALLLGGGGGFLLANVLGAGSSSSEEKPADEEPEEPEALALEDADGCSAREFGALMDSTVDAADITALDEIPVEDILTIGNSIYCAGDYSTEDPEADRPRFSLVILETGEDGLDEIATALEDAGFEPADNAGGRGLLWSDGETQAYAADFEDAAGDTDLVDDPAQLIAVGFWPAV